MFKTRLVDSWLRAHARVPRAPVVPLLVPVEICHCTLCLAVIVSCLVLFCSVGLWWSCPIQVDPATSHSPQGCARTPHASCGRTRHLPQARALRELLCRAATSGPRNSSAGSVPRLHRPRFPCPAVTCGPWLRVVSPSQEAVGRVRPWRRASIWVRIRACLGSAPCLWPLQSASAALCVPCFARLNRQNGTPLPASSCLNICQWVPFAFRGARPVAGWLVEAALTAIRLPLTSFLATKHA